MNIARNVARMKAPNSPATVPDAQPHRTNLILKKTSHTRIKYSVRMMSTIEFL
ncbi:hypothetical protein [Bradyrhizobium sp. CER78]|uniref:hypothetical protein n=1 Tax=Bradyrhizobium sp. CER78 TaxID=3039162 RepID=UPI002447F3C5|nr:hypothetical protein [Bradyrhizobium sp. CER78]MDH2384528.1 hypothetical protein [Bradyrhizobium sp. CER78]